VREGQTSKKRPVFVNGVRCEGMSEGARYSSEVLKRTVYLWEIQRILNGKKRIDGLEVIRADEPLPRKPKKAKRRRKYSAEARRGMSEARKGKPGFWKGKRRKDITKQLLSQAISGEKNPAAKLTEDQVLDILQALTEGEKIFTLSRRYGVSEAAISRIKTGKRWKHLAKEYEA
jgi:hypothetical protein